METSFAILLSMLLPGAAVLSNMLLRNSPDLRDGLTLGAAIATFMVVLNILANVGNTTTETFTFLTVMPGLELAFNVEPLGLMFALLASGLWIVTHLYGLGYMRGNNDGSSRISMALAICAAIMKTIMQDSLPVSLSLFFR